MTRCRLYNPRAEGKVEWSRRVLRQKIAYELMTQEKVSVNWAKNIPGYMKCLSNKKETLLDRRDLLRSIWTENLMSWLRNLWTLKMKWSVKKYAKKWSVKRYAKKWSVKWSVKKYANLSRQMSNRNNTNKMSENVIRQEPNS